MDDDQAGTANLPEHVAKNRGYWDANADWWAAPGERAWRQDEPTWGVWGVPESDLHMLPADMTGMATVELGCGTGYVSSWMARRGARATGIDNSSEQLATAARWAREHAVDLTLVHGNAEATPFADDSFDFAISEYGASIWCDPFAWIPEAHRILKPGGRLVFLGFHPLVAVCDPPDGTATGDRLLNNYFELHKLDYSQVPADPGGVEFTLPLSGWFTLFAGTGFAVEGFLEPRAPAAATSTPFPVPPEWAKQWPSEQVWKLRKR